MAWNQPGNNGQDRDHWEATKLAATLQEMETKAVAIKGHPDLDDIFRKLSKSSVVWAAVKAPDLAVAVHRKAAPAAAVASLPSRRQRLSLSGRPVVSTPLKKPNAAW